MGEHATGSHDYSSSMGGPQIDRFNGPDTAAPELANPASFNRYAYVLNNPYKYVDPDGHVAWLPWTMGVGAVGGGIAAGAVSYRAGVRGWNLFTDILAGIGYGGLAGTGIGLLVDAAAAPGLQNAAQQAEARAPVVEGEAAAAAKNPVLQAKAASARDALASELAGQRHPPATVVGAYSPATRQVTAGASRGGGLGCAEGVCSEKLGAPADIQFTTAVRPRTGQTVPVCQNCEATYGRSAFPADAVFKSDQKN